MNQDVDGSDRWKQERLYFWETAGLGALLGPAFALVVSAVDQHSSNPLIYSDKARWVYYPAISAILGGFLAALSAGIWPAPKEGPWPHMLLESSLSALFLHSGFIVGLIWRSQTS